MNDLARTLRMTLLGVVVIVALILAVIWFLQPFNDLDSTHTGTTGMDPEGAGVMRRPVENRQSLDISGSS